MSALPSTLAQFPTFNENGALQLLSGICGAINHLHAKGFYHCDIKPGNTGINALLATLCSLIWQHCKIRQSCLTYACLHSTRRETALSNELDWWILGMTIAEKYCREYGLQIARGAQEPVKTTLRDHLTYHLPSIVQMKIKLLSDGLFDTLILQHQQ